MTRQALFAGLLLTAGMLGLGPAASATEGAEVMAEGTFVYQRLPLYQASWPSVEDGTKDLELPLVGMPANGTSEDDGHGILPLKLRWLPGHRLVFEDGGEATTAPFLELAANVASGLGLDLRWELGSFVVRREEGLRALAVQSVYSPGNTRYFTQTEARWTVCLVEPSTDQVPADLTIRAASCQETPFDVSSFVWQVEYAPEARWMHAAVDSEGERGFRTRSIPLLRDHDGDGYTDFVLWRRFEVSVAAVRQRAMTDDAAEYELERDELWLVRYDPASRAFADPTPISGPVPDAALGIYQALMGSL